MKIDVKYFIIFNFDKEQVHKNFDNALKDINIAEKDKILEVKFSYCYTALIKAGIALLSHSNIKARSIPGHHIKIIEKIAEILKDETIIDIGNIMRSKRNLDLYAGGIEITEKECQEYIAFVKEVINKIKKVIA